MQNHKAGLSARGKQRGINHISRKLVLINKTGKDHISVCSGSMTHLSELRRGWVSHQDGGWHGPWVTGKLSACEWKFRSLVDFIRLGEFSHHIHLPYKWKHALFPYLLSNISEWPSSCPQWTYIWKAKGEGGRETKRADGVNVSRDQATELPRERWHRHTLAFSIRKGGQKERGKILDKALQAMK